MTEDDKNRPEIGGLNMTQLTKSKKKTAITINVVLY